MKEIATSLSKHVAIVSGGSSGIGHTIATRLASQGAAVVVGGRDEQRCAAAVAGLVASGGRAIAARGDVAQATTAETLVTAALDTFGRLDVVINAAGAIHRADATGTSDEDWRRVMAANVDGTFFLSRAAIEPLRAQGGGSIVNISSTCGLVGAAGLAAYCAAKGAVTNLTRAMAIDHADEGIRINAICPGAVDTPMLASGRTPDADMAEIQRQNEADIPQGRIADADEIAALVSFLCSDEARHITGANLSIDGGYTAR